MAVCPGGSKKCLPNIHFQEGMQVMLMMPFLGAECIGLDFMLEKWPGILTQDTV